MSLDKAVKHGKEKRKPYYGAKSVDRTCRNHGPCPFCTRGRRHKVILAKEVAREQLNDLTDS